MPRPVQRREETELRDGAHLLRRPGSSCWVLVRRIIVKPVAATFRRSLSKGGAKADSSLRRADQGTWHAIAGGPGGNRTHIRGFAVRCITTLPPDHWAGSGRKNRKIRRSAAPREHIAGLSHIIQIAPGFAGLLSRQCPAWDSGSHLEAGRRWCPTQKRRPGRSQSGGCRPSGPVIRPRYQPMVAVPAPARA